jgi:hypothetical protein
VNILVTSARLPFALDEIRKLGRAGHRIWAADSVWSAPGAHSRWAQRRVHVAAPAQDPRRFVDDVLALVEDDAIDLVVPTFEEAVPLAWYFERLPLPPVRLFAPRFAVLARLHNKAAFNALARALGLNAPSTTLVTNRAALARALGRHASYFARPAWSRGGLELLTNAGPLAGTLALADCTPTRRAPWIVQEYIPGEDVCSFSVARAGHVVAHCAYIHPRQLDHAGGIVFESIPAADTLACVERIVAITGYDGQISMDFHQRGHELWLLECNPRPTAGVHLMPDDMFVDAVVGPAPVAVRLVPPGLRRQYTAALVRDLILRGGGDDLFTEIAWMRAAGDDVYAEAGDLAPALFQVLSYAQVLAYRLRHGGRARAALKAAQFEGITWSGESFANWNRNQSINW